MRVGVVAMLGVLGCASSAAPEPTIARSVPSSSSIAASASIAPEPVPSVSATEVTVESSVAAAVPPPKPGIPINLGTKILVFGDSMVWAGLSTELEKLAKARGATVFSDSWSSSTTKVWSTSKRLPTLLYNIAPDVIFIVVGANEVYLIDPNAAANVHKLVSKLGDRPCVLVGPPVWKSETGIVAAERDNAAPCTFFDSSHLKLERQPDGIHPTTKGGALWADALWDETVEQ